MKDENKMKAEIEAFEKIMQRCTNEEAKSKAIDFLMSLHWKTRKMLIERGEWITEIGGIGGKLGDDGQEFGCLYSNQSFNSGHSIFNKTTIEVYPKGIEVVIMRDEGRLLLRKEFV